MQYLSADCILPVNGEPCFDSVLAVADDHCIEGIFNKNELEIPHGEIRHYNGILCPGFVNTHCHLELSWAKGLISPGEGLDKFIWQLEKFRKSVSGAFVQRSVENSAASMSESGIVATADISNSDLTLEYKSKTNHYFHTFVEVFGSNPADAGSVFKKAVELKSLFENNPKGRSASIVAHSTYSLSDELFRLVAGYTKNGISSIHHQENTDENLFFLDGSGPIAARRKVFNPDLPSFPGNGKRPIENIASYFSQGQKILLVHNTVSQNRDIDFAEQYFTRAYWCFCPNANMFIEKQLPDINIFRNKGCRITLGTDSLASNYQLNILEEIKTIQQNFPEIPLPELIRWGTLNGAEFLEQEYRLGSFERGKSPGVVLIEYIDPETLSLKPESTSRLLIPALI